MMTCYDVFMRTTLNVDETLLREAKSLAARSGRSVGAVVEDALRVLLFNRIPSQKETFSLPIGGSGGLRPGVDLEDKESLAAVLEDEDAFIHDHG